MNLKGTRFDRMEGIKWNATVELGQIPKQAPPVLPTMAGSMAELRARAKVQP
jgi:hypothetical protein